MDKRISAALKIIGFWSNRANDAYNMGEAPWVYTPGKGNYLTGLVASFVNDAPDDPDAWETAAAAVKVYAQAAGIDPRRHKMHVGFTRKTHG